MKTVKIGILGYGTVGQGVLELFSKNHTLWQQKTGVDLVIKSTVKRNWDNVEKPAGVICSNDLNEIVNDPEIDIVVELMGGVTTAFDAVSTAIKNNKHIVTANKALIAEKGDDLFALAKTHGVNIFYEASVAGGIPVIKALKEGLIANQISSVAGIINGTCNYILSCMKNQGRSFEDVLVEAKALGYAEADPTFDIEGVDAAHKLCILASIAYGIPLEFSKLSIEGITQIATQDIQHADNLGYVIKHLGIAIKTNHGVELRVHPTLIPKKNALSKVDGVMNAVRLFGDAAGEIILYGAGAGSLPTASAVMADVLGVASQMHNQNISPLGYAYDVSVNSAPVLDKEAQQSANYLRLRVKDKKGVMANIAKLLAEHDISIEALFQKEPQMDETEVDVVMVTQVVNEANLQSAITAITTQDDVLGEVTRIRVEHFG